MLASQIIQNTTNSTTLDDLIPLEKEMSDGLAQGKITTRDSLTIRKGFETKKMSLAKIISSSNQLAVKTSVSTLLPDGNPSTSVTKKGKVSTPLNIGPVLDFSQEPDTQNVSVSLLKPKPKTLTPPTIEAIIDTTSSDTVKTNSSSNMTMNKSSSQDDDDEEINLQNATSNYSQKKQVAGIPLPPAIPPTKPLFTSSSIPNQLPPPQIVVKPLTPTQSQSQPQSTSQSSTTFNNLMNSGNLNIPNLLELRLSDRSIRVRELAPYLETVIKMNFEIPFKLSYDEKLVASNLMSFIDLESQTHIDIIPYIKTQKLRSQYDYFFYQLFLSIGTPSFSLKYEMIVSMKSMFG
jgi:hypothetical protein